MPLEYTPINQLNSSKKEWKIKALLCRTWDFYLKDKPGVILGMEVILVDEKGDRVQASVKQKLIKKFRSDLKEGECCDIMNFEVVENHGDYRGTTHPYKINFLFTTYVKPCEQIPNLSHFNFCPFAEILAQSNVDDGFIDILGEIVGISDIMEKNISGNSSKLLDIQLRDLNETIIQCTLWEQHAEYVHSYAKSNNTGPIILLGSLMRTKKYNGKISVQNSRFSTKLILNGDLEEVNAFKTKMAKGDKSVSSTISSLIAPTLIKNTIDSFPLSSWKTVDQFTSATEESTCVAFASILAFRKELPWYYVGCSKCFTSATPYFNPETEEIESNKYSCDTCDKHETTTSLRYKVHLKVADHTESTSFLLFDREVIQLIHKSVYELLEQQVQFNREGEIPQELMDLEGRKIVCIIRVNGTEKKYRQSSFKVVKLTEKPETIQKFEDNVVLMDTHSEMPAISSTSTAIEMENTSSEANNNESTPYSPVTPITKRQRNDILEDGVQQSSTKLMATSSTSTAIEMENTSSEANNNESTPYYPVTPITKRQRNDILEDGVQQSSTNLMATSKLDRGERVNKEINKGIVYRSCKDNKQK